MVQVVAQRPYEGGTPVTWNVPGHGSHAADDGGRRRPKALCSFTWAKGEGRVVPGLPDNRECLREVQLGAERPRGRW